MSFKAEESLDHRADILEALSHGDRQSARATMQHSETMRWHGGSECLHEPSRSSGQSIRRMRIGRGSHIVQSNLHLLAGTFGSCVGWTVNSRNSTFNGPKDNIGAGL